MPHPHPYDPTCACCSDGPAPEDYRRAAVASVVNAGPVLNVGPASIPTGRRTCPECGGSGMIGGNHSRTGNDPQEEWSTDCPTCDPHDGSASLGHVSVRRG